MGSSKNKRNNTISVVLLHQNGSNLVHHSSTRCLVSFSVRGLTIVNADLRCATMYHIIDSMMDNKEIEQYIRNDDIAEVCNVYVIKFENVQTAPLAIDYWLLVVVLLNLFLTVHINKKRSYTCAIYTCQWPPESYSLVELGRILPTCFNCNIIIDK